MVVNSRTELVLTFSSMFSVLIQANVELITVQLALPGQEGEEKIHILVQVEKRISKSYSTWEII